MALPWWQHRKHCCGYYYYYYYLLSSLQYKQTQLLLTDRASTAHINNSKFSGGGMVVKFFMRRIHRDAVGGINLMGGIVFHGNILDTFGYYRNCGKHKFHGREHFSTEGNIWVACGHYVAAATTMRSRRHIWQKITPVFNPLASHRAVLCWENQNNYLRHVEESTTICQAVSTQYRNVTDRRMDRQMDGQNSYINITHCWADTWQKEK